MKGVIVRFKGFVIVLFMFCFVSGTVSATDNQVGRTVQESNIDISNDGIANIYLNLRNVPSNSEIMMPTWSENYGQDDIIWYQAGKSEEFTRGNWKIEGKSYNYRLSVNKNKHKNVTYGLFHSHLYINNGYAAAYDYQITGGKGYWTDFHNFGCTRYICSSGGDGSIREHGLGQWWEPCITCVNGGRPNNDFLIKESSDQYFYCYHYPNGIQINALDGYHGVYRRGQCQYNKGWATLDTRVSAFSHDYYFCPGHRTANTYTIKYDGNGGLKTMGDSVFQYDSEKRLSKNLFQKEGFRFLGWAKAKDAKKIEYQDMQTIQNLTAENGAVITLYAVWEEINPNPPTIQAEDIYIHKDDSEVPVTKELLLSKAKAEDIEDGNLTKNIVVKNLDDVFLKASQEFTKEEIAHAKKTIEVQYFVADSGGKRAETTANLYIIYPATSNPDNGYVRFIEEPYVNGILDDSIWADKKELLGNILRKSMSGIKEEQL